MVSRITAWTVQHNEVEVIETSERCECWLIQDSKRTELLLSCPLENRADMDDAIQKFKSPNEDEAQHHMKHDAESSRRSWLHWTH